MLPIITPLQRAEMTIQYVESNGKAPSHKLEWNGVSIGGFWGRIKCGDSPKIYSTILCKNPILKAEYESTQEFRKKKLEEGVLSKDEKVGLLIQFITEKKRVPKQTETYNKCQIGAFWGAIKAGHNADTYTDKLCKVALLKVDYEKRQQIKESKKDKHIYTPEEKAKILLDYVIEYKSVPPFDCDIHIGDDVIHIGNFWDAIKVGKNKQIWETKLISNEILSKDYSRVEKERLVRGPNHLKMIGILKEIDHAPRFSELIDELPIGKLWSGMKKGNHTLDFDMLVKHNNVLKNDANAGNKKALGVKEKIQLLVSLNRIPSNGEKVQGYNLYTFWKNILKGQCKKEYDNTLSKIQIFKDNYDKVNNSKK